MKGNGRFFKSYYDLMSASGFVGNNGELVKLTLTEKNIYCLMLSRYEYFVKEKGGAYYGTQESIGCALDIDRRTMPTHTIRHAPKWWRGLNQSEHEE